MKTWAQHQPSVWWSQNRTADGLQNKTGSINRGSFVQVSTAHHLPNADTSPVCQALLLCILEAFDSPSLTKSIPITIHEHDQN